MPDDAQILRAATSVCRRKGYPVDDPDFGSAVGWGVFKALSGHKHNRGRTLTSYAVLLALRECESVRRQHEKQARRDRAAARPDSIEDGEPSPLSEADWEIMRFVAKHGDDAARRLGMSQERLDEVVWEMAERFSNASDNF